MPIKCSFSKLCGVENARSREDFSLLLIGSLVCRTLNLAVELVLELLLRIDGHRSAVLHWRLRAGRQHLSIATIPSSNSIVFAQLWAYNLQLRGTIRMFTYSSRCSLILKGPSPNTFIPPGTCVRSARLIDNCVLRTRTWNFRRSTWRGGRAALCISCSLI